MMRLWVESYSRSTPVSSSAVISVVTHALLIGVAIVSTTRPPNLQADWIENRPYYLPPPNRAPGQQGSRETIKYIALAPEGVGAGYGPVGVGSPEKSVVHDPSEKLGDLGRDLTNSDNAPKLGGDDSVFTQLEVDSIVARYPGSAAPAYPIEMLKQGVQGSVTTQYVVDTTGFADTTSLRILRTTNAEFTDAVRAALPFMRFFPAKVGAKKVRQLVEQEFSFKIEQAANQTTPATQASAKKSGLDKPIQAQRNPRG
jgi:TonB family protein